MEMTCRGTVGHLLPRHDQLAKQKVLGGQMLMDPVGLVRIHVKFKFCPGRRRLFPALCVICMFPLFLPAYVPLNLLHFPNMWR